MCHIYCIKKVNLHVVIVNPGFKVPKPQKKSGVSQLLQDATFLHICPKTQPTEKHTAHVITNYVTETYMSTKLDIYANYLIGLYGKCIHIYVPHMKSLQSQSTMWHGALYTYLTYIIEQIWLPDCTCMFNCTAAVVHLYTPHYYTYNSNS